MSTDETLRVAPVDERPEFVAQGKVDDSQTRIFGKLNVQAEEAVQEAALAIEKAVEALPVVEQIPDAVQGDTVRLDRAVIEEVNRREEAVKQAPKGKKRDEIKPMKKKKGGFFGRKKIEEDDLLDADEDFDDGEDDFI